MPDIEQNQDSDFMREKIKERPLNKKKLLRRTLITASMAVIFGLIACVTFLLLEPVISNWLYPEEEPKVVEFPEDTEEIAPEDMLVEDVPQESQQEAEINLEDEQIAEILSGIEWSVEDYRTLYSSLKTYTRQLSRTIVTVTGAVSNVDWFSEAYESEGASSGVIFYNNGKELLILVDRTPLEKAETLSATFYDGTEVEAAVKQFDSNTNLAVLSVRIEDLSSVLQADPPVAALGASNITNLSGTPIVVLGSPMGTQGSVCFGNIASSQTTISVADANYKLLQTDVFGSQNSSGVVFDLQGQILGIVVNGWNPSDMKNLVSALGISELKKMISKMGNGEPIVYMGIEGTDVTKEAHEELGVPYGAYIKEIYMDSPAMLAGIQRGDIIVDMNQKQIDRFLTYTNALQALQPGETIQVKVMRQVQNEYKEMTFEVTIDTAG